MTESQGAQESQKWPILGRLRGRGLSEDLKTLKIAIGACPRRAPGILLRTPAGGWNPKEAADSALGVGAALDARPCGALTYEKET